MPKKIVKQKPKLTVKQKRFADYYIETGNATEAAIKAGYSKKTCYSIGNENLRKPEVKNYIDEKLKELDDNRTMKAKEVMELLTSIARDEITEQVVIGGEFGADIVTKGMSAKDRLKALELLGKRFAMWTDRQQIESNSVVTFVDDIGEDDED